MDFVRDHERLYNKTNEHFNDKSRKGCLWDQFTNSCKVSVKVYKTWFDSKMTGYGKLTQSKSGQALKEMAECQN